MRSHNTLVRIAPESITIKTQFQSFDSGCQSIKITLKSIKIVDDERLLQ